MSFDVSGWSIRRPVPTLVLFLVLTLAGMLSFSQLGIDANPNIDLPFVSIETAYAGAGPKELESQFTKKVENAVAGLSNVEEIYSGIGDGQAYTNVRFALEADIDQSIDDVRDAIDRIREDLSPYAESMTIQQLRYDDGAVITCAVRSEQRSGEELSDLVDRTISPALGAVKGVAEVRRIGGVDREIRVELDPYQLDAYGISAAQVNAQIRAFNKDLPGGRTQVSGQEQSIRALGKLPTQAASLAALNSLEIALPSGSTLPLQTLATVIDGFAEVRQAATVNGQSVVSFGVFRSNDSLLVSVEDGVKGAIAQLETETLPDDIELQLIFTRATDIRATYQASIEALILGSILAVVVVGCFLRNWRTTLITAVALPLSIIPTFIVIKALGYSLNSMTLLALTLAVGNLVDDAIVEIENIERHLSLGKSPTQAALDSSAEVGLAVVTTTATIVAVFIPVAFMGGIPGQFFKPFGVTVAVSTMFSTLVARFATPLLASRLLKSKRFSHSPVGENSARLEVSKASLSTKPSAYAQLLASALRHRLVTLCLAIAIFISSLVLIPYLPTGLYGSGNTDLSNLSVTLPPGTTFSRTQALTQTLSDRILTHPDVDSLYLDQRVAAADAVIRLKPKGERQLSRKVFEQQLREQLRTIPELQFSFDSQGASGSDKALNIVLKSPNAERLTATANQLAQQMRQLPGLVEVSTSTGLVKPELLIIPNPSQAKDLGVQLSDIAAMVTLATLGDRDADLAEIDAGERQIPIRVQLAEAHRTNLASLVNLKVPGSSEDGQQQLVPLSAVAEVVVSGGPAELSRFDRERQITVGANLQGMPLGQALDAVYDLPVLKNLPSDVSEQATGDADILQDVFTRFALALATAIVMIYAVLVLLYNSFIYPLAVMSALPLSIGGTFIALLLAQKPLDLYALIGIVLLMGLVTKNSILLVDYALLACDRGCSLKQAVMEASTTRLRPILMTSISTVAGMVPIALEIGAGGEVRSPMAIAVIGGFSTATLLTLVVVPVCFTYTVGLRQRVNGLGHWVSGLFNQFWPNHNRMTDRFISGNRTFNLATAVSSSAILSPMTFTNQPSSKSLHTTESHQCYSPTAAHTVESDALEVPQLMNIPYEESPYSNTFANPSQIAQVEATSLEEISTQQGIELPGITPQNTEPHYTLACIENDSATLQAIRNYLDDTVFTIISVNEPAIALSDLTRHRPDIILMTTSMLGLDGFKVCARLRKSPLFRTVPIILLAPKITWRTRLKSKWYGASNHLEKPLDKTQFLIELFLLMI